MERREVDKTSASGAAGIALVAKGTPRLDGVKAATWEELVAVFLSVVAVFLSVSPEVDRLGIAAELELCKTARVAE